MRVANATKKLRITGLFMLRRSSGSGFRSPRSFRYAPLPRLTTPTFLQPWSCYASPYSGCKNVINNQDVIRHKTGGAKRLRFYARITGCMRRFGGPNKEMRSIYRAGKMCRSNGVGMERYNETTGKGDRHRTGKRRTEKGGFNSNFTFTGL
jgi:hypothetical protein